MNKICVYTCITGNYDNLKKIEYKEKNIDYICFTNNRNITSCDWKIVYISEDLDNLTLARKVKILGYQYLKDYDLTVWIDGAISLRKPISKFISECCELDKYDMIGFNHQLRDCIYDEINECVRVGKESVENGLNLEKFLIKQKYPTHNGLIESTVLVRKNVDSVNTLMDKWFKMLFKYSRRDQLSFNYCLWKKPIKIKMLDMWVFDNPYFIHDQHSKKNEYKKYRLYLGNATNFDFHKCIDGIYTNDELKNGLKIKLPIDTNRLELTIDEVGKYISSVSLNKKNTSFIYNVYEIDNKKYFYDSSIISFEGKFKKNDELVFKIDVSDEKLDIRAISESIKDNNEMIKKLESENQSLNSLISKMLNSKSWKLTRPLRKIRKYIKK